jgi:GntR family negative regulator for fad regulon and positive regulator of fabA
MENLPHAWETPRKPAELTEDRLLTAILDGTFPINSALPSERELAEMLGVTRPTLREALQRLSRDGWVEIHHGKTTRVRDYWREGNLLILSAIARHGELLSGDFVTQLLQIRLLMAPEYARMAIQNQGSAVLEALADLHNLDDSPEEFSRGDFLLHRQLTVLSGNPIFTLILNGFGDLYIEMGKIYFANPEARGFSRDFYGRLESAIRKGDVSQAHDVVRGVMLKSIELWNAAAHRTTFDGREG